MAQTRTPHAHVKGQPVQESPEEDQPNPERWLVMYRDMVRIRFFEEQVNDLYRTARMPGLAHLYSGEEAVAVGVCQALRRDDYITSTHRGHGHCLAKGASIDRMFAELLGKEPGYCRGKGGSMHIADQDTGNLGANAIVGGSAGIATGAAFSSKMQKLGRVAVCFFGDGALGQGVLYEVMNMASLWKLPILYVCENNLYNEYTHNTETTAGSMSERAAAFAIPTAEIDGQDVRLVYATARQQVERARMGEGPGFILANTYRYHGHHVGDVQRAYYRSKEEEEFWKAERDPISILSAWLLAENLTTAKHLERIRAEVQAEIAAGVEFGLNAPFPEISEVGEHVYA
jgi:acetoin:2,6-dichlorophenolindophenol oxidoreductase subunit alpha